MAGTMCQIGYVIEDILNGGYFDDDNSTFRGIIFAKLYMTEAKAEDIAMNILNNENSINNLTVKRVFRRIK